MSRWSKIATILSIPVGLLYGGVAIYMEETGLWVEQDSYLYFSITAPIIIYIGYLVWPLTKFTVREDNA
jgi:hypothetical protein